MNPFGSWFLDLGDYRARGLGGFPPTRLALANIVLGRIDNSQRGLTRNMPLLNESAIARFEELAKCDGGTIGKIGLEDRENLIPAASFTIDDSIRFLELKNLI